MNKKEKQYKYGQDDYNRTKDDFLGPSKHRTWPKVFESTEEWEEREKAYEQGWENARKTHEEN